MQKSMTGTAGQKRVSSKTISKFICPLPSIKEQCRIVERVEELSLYTTAIRRVEN